MLSGLCYLYWREINISVAISTPTWKGEEIFNVPQQYDNRIDHFVDWGNHSTLVAHWTVCQQVEQSILHVGHDSYQILSH